MNELRRLLDEDCDELSRALLNAAAEDEPPRGSLAAVAAVLGVAPGLTAVSWLGSGSSTAVSGASGSVGAAGAGSSLATTGAAAGAGVGAATSLTAMVVAKYVAFGMVSGLFAMGGLSLVADTQYASSRDASLPAVTRELNTAAPLADASRAMLPSVPSLVGEGPRAAEDASQPPAKVLGRAARAARPAAGPGAAAAAAVVADDAKAAAAAFVDETPKPAESAQAVEQNKGLAKELALLDRARRSLLAGNASEALALLEQYRSVRVSMILDPEAEALRILTLDRLGQHATASRLAREFIAGHPASRQVDSLRQLANRP